MEIYKSKYWVINFDEKNKIINPVWLEASAELTDEIYKMEMERYTEFVEKYSALYALVNCFNLKYAISPTVQEWTNENLFPRIHAVGQRHVAILMPSEIITQLSLEQIMEESNGLQFKTAYFGNEEEAIKWFFN